MGNDLILNIEGENIKVCENVILDVDGKDSIPVVFSLNDNYVWITLISMVSIAVNTTKKVDFIILYNELSARTFQILDSIKKYSNCHVTYIKINADVFKRFQSSSWTTIHTWFRALIPNLLPNADKSIYLDCDTMVRGDIEEFYNIDISDVLVGAVTDVWGVAYGCERLKMKSSSYFNAGILLINNKKWREVNLFEQLKYQAINFPDLKNGDQDVLNVVIDCDKKVLSTRYNFLETWWSNYYIEYKGADLDDYEFSKKNPLIVHFTAYKPNTPRSRHSYRHEWWNYAKRTPYYTYMLEKYKDDAEKYIDSLSKK